MMDILTTKDQQGLLRTYLSPGTPNPLRVSYMGLQTHLPMTLRLP